MNMEKRKQIMNFIIENGIDEYDWLIRVWNECVLSSELGNELLIFNNTADAFLAARAHGKGPIAGNRMVKYSADDYYVCFAGAQARSFSDLRETDCPLDLCLMVECLCDMDDDKRRSLGIYLVDEVSPDEE
jgi:hypothetical protein